MDAAPAGSDSIARSLRRIAQRLLAMGQNRLELLVLEAQEERDRLLHVLVLVLWVSLFVGLAAFTLTALLILVLWTHAPWGLPILGVVQAGVAGLVAWRLRRYLRSWRAFAASLDQMRKDRSALEDVLS